MKNDRKKLIRLDFVNPTELGSFVKNGYGLDGVCSGFFAKILDQINSSENSINEFLDFCKKYPDFKTGQQPFYSEEQMAIHLTQADFEKLSFFQLRIGLIFNGIIPTRNLAASMVVFYWFEETKDGDDDER